jgi:hypothetical protein
MPVKEHLQACPQRRHTRRGARIQILALTAQACKHRAGHEACVGRWSQQQAAACFQVQAAYRGTLENAEPVEIELQAWAGAGSAHITPVENGSGIRAHALA